VAVLPSDRVTSTETERWCVPFEIDGSVPDSRVSGFQRIPQLKLTCQSVRQKSTLTAVILAPHVGWKRPPRVLQIQPPVSLPPSIRMADDAEIMNDCQQQGSMEGCVGRGKIGLRPVMRDGWRRR
jgi:hypothetical protein